MLRRATCAAIALGVSLLTAPTARAQAAAQGPDEALAWRLDTISTATLSPNAPESAYRRSAAVLQAAARLDPKEPRFPRLRMLALERAGDNDGALSALLDYRKLAPDDRVAVAELIDLYAARMQTADAKIAYLRGIIEKQNLAPEVRARAAVQCAAVLFQRSPSEAGDMARRAVRIYPLPEAERQAYEWSGKALPLKQRVAALVGLLTVNPNQRIIDPSASGNPNAMPYAAELAAVLASGGMSEASLEWYELASFLVVNGGSARPPRFHDLLIDFASQLMVASTQSSGQASAVYQQKADTLVGRMLDENSNDSDAWFVKLTAGQASAGEVAFGQTLELARTALTRQWNAVSYRILNGPASTQPDTASPAGSQPASANPVSAQQVIDKLKSLHNAQAEEAFASTAGDLAWFELYYDKQPDAAKPWIDALRAMLADDSPTVLRLVGWLQLAQGHATEARETLSKIADRDPLAELGLLRADELEKKTLNADAVRKLLSEHRTGLVAAILWAALKDPKALPATPNDAAGVIAELKKVPGEWLSAIVNPRQVRRVYLVSGEPLRTPLSFGDPVLYRITLENSSDRDIVISSDGILRPDLWINAQISGLARQSFKGVAYDQIINQIVLRAHSSMSQVVRIDQGGLRQAMERSPGAATRATIEVETNPMAGPENSVIAGIGGVDASLGRGFAWGGVAVAHASGRKLLDSAIASNSPADRMRALDLMASYLRLAARSDADEQVRAAVADFPGIVKRLATDPSEPVSAWATFVLATLSAPDQQERIVTEMSTSPYWGARLLSLFGGTAMPADRLKELASSLAEKETDPSVKAAALATSDLLERATTQPTTQSTTQPTTQPISDQSPAH